MASTLIYKILEKHLVDEKLAAGEAIAIRIDHNMSPFGPENHNDHLYLQTIATKAGTCLAPFIFSLLLN